MGQRLRAAASDLSLIIASGSVWESGSRLWYALNTIAISIIINKIQNSVTLIINQYGTVNYIKQENVYKIFFLFYLSACVSRTLIYTLRIELEKMYKKEHVFGVLPECLHNNIIAIQHNKANLNELSGEFRNIKFYITILLTWREERRREFDGIREKFYPYKTQLVKLPISQFW